MSNASCLDATTCGSPQVMPPSSERLNAIVLAAKSFHAT
jgi:hypothetical protein